VTFFHVFPISLSFILTDIACPFLPFLYHFPIFISFLSLFITYSPFLTHCPSYFSLLIYPVTFFHIFPISLSFTLTDIACPFLPFLYHFPIFISFFPLFITYSPFLTYCPSYCHQTSGGTNHSTFPYGKLVVCLRFEVLTAVTMKNSVFWDVTSCGSYKNRRLRGT
jgi:hypothetical protein